VISAFGVEHGVSKSLKPRHLEALKRVASRDRDFHRADAYQKDYAQDRLSLHGIQDYGKDIAQRMTGTRGMYKEGTDRAVKYNAKQQGIERKYNSGKSGVGTIKAPLKESIKVIRENNPIRSARRRGHLKLV